MEVARVRAQISSLEAIEGSLRGEVASAKEHNRLLEQEYSSLKLKVTSLESIIAEKVQQQPDGIFINEDGVDVDVHVYRSMIGSLMYLTESRPDIMFVVCACASDYGGASLDRKSTTGGCQFLGRRLISWQCKKQTIVANSTTEAEYVAANCCG
ncbi:hypothetical protein Tco_1195993, partial [Tanacetum coccineum]